MAMRIQFAGVVAVALMARTFAIVGLQVKGSVP